MHFADHDAPRPCWTCQYYCGLLLDNDINGLCRHPRLWPMVGQPEYGCAFGWEREPGADDKLPQP